jgi:hypothetical protein
VSAACINKSHRIWTWLRWQTASSKRGRFQHDGCVRAFVCVKFMAHTSARGTFCRLLLLLRCASYWSATPCSSQVSLTASPACTVGWLEARSFSVRVIVTRSPWTTLQPHSETCDWLFIAPQRHSRWSPSDTSHSLTQPTVTASCCYVVALIVVFVDRQTDVPYLSCVTVFWCLALQLHRSTPIIKSRSSVRL